MKELAYLRVKRHNPVLDSKDVVASMPYKELRHLQEKVKALEKGGSAWWNTKCYRKFLSEYSKFFVTADGFIHGYFGISHIEENAESGDYRIYFQDYQTIKHIGKKGFQGIRYRDFEYEEI